MMRYVIYFFAILGVIFFFVLCGLAYVWFADPWNIRPFFEMTKKATTTNFAGTPQAGEGGGGGGTPTASKVVNEQVDNHPALSQEQEAALEQVGVNVDALPTTMTPDMEVCFAKKIGVGRVADIKAGASPTPSEVALGLPCVGQ